MVRRFFRWLFRERPAWVYDGYYFGNAHRRTDLKTGRSQYRPTAAHPWFDE